MTWILNLRSEDATFDSSASWSWRARVVFPEEGRPENITRGMTVPEDRGRYGGMICVSENDLHLKISISPGKTVFLHYS